MFQLPDHTVDLIFTSPPYANQRKKQYASYPVTQYVDWFLPIAAQLQRVLKPTGTFILNIKENIVNSERSPYVLELILACANKAGYGRKNLSGIKKIVFPVNGRIGCVTPGRRLLQFNRQKQFCMYQETVRVPYIRPPLNDYNDYEIQIDD